MKKQYLALSLLTPVLCPALTAEARTPKENKVTNRLIYLFLIEIEDENLLRDKQTRDGKLWTFQQIEHNLDKNFFSCCFENEYEHLKDVIYTREKYKEF